MDSQRLFSEQPDYEVPLLRVLAKLPGGRGETDYVCRQVEAEYGHQIPDEHRETYITGEPKWRNNVRWCRKSLLGRGFLDGSVRGLWKITEEGRQWLEEHPAEDRIPGWSKDPEGSEPPPRKMERQGPAAPRKQRRRQDSPPDWTLEQLEDLREIAREAGRPEFFDQHYGRVYDQLLAEEHAKAISEITPSELGRRTRRWLDQVHTVLSGKASAPASEVVCDWIQFCYRLDLCREAVALLPFVHETEVDPASYARAKRVAEACRSRAAG